LSFTGGTVEAGFDLITVYDGNSNAFPVLGSFDGPAAGQTFQGTGGSLYFELVTDTSFSCQSGQVAGPLTWDVYCATAVPGCTDQDALNYNSNATVDDGSCEIVPCDVDDNTPPVADGSFTYCYDSNVVQGFGFSSTNPGVDSPSIFIVQGNFEPNFDVFTVYDGADNTAPIIISGWGNFAGSLFTASGDDLYIEIVTDASVSCVSSATYVDLIVDYYCATAIIPGCTDPTATNYNMDATVDDGSCVYPPVNNACIDAIDVQCGDAIAGTTINATDDEGFIGGGGCGVPITSPGVWYRFNGTDELVTLSTCQAANFDTRISVFTGSCNGALVCETGGDDGCGVGLQTDLPFSAAFGEIYYIYVHGFGLAAGDFTLSITCAPDPCLGAPVAPNDDCANAQLFIDGFIFTPDLCCTTAEANVAQQCSFNTTTGVWYVYSNANNFDDIFFDIINQQGPGSFAGVSIYLADPLAAPGTECDNLQILACCQDFAGQCQGSMSLIPGATPLVPGGLYYFNVWSSTPEACGVVSIQATGLINGCTDPAANNYNGAATQDDGSCTYTLPPANDLCGDAVIMNCGDALVNQSTGAATATGGPGNCGATYPGVWYTWTGTGDYATVATCGSTIDSYVRVLEGPCGGPYTCVDFEDDDIQTCGFFDADDASISFFSTLGTNYFFYVSGFNGQQGVFNIDLTCEPVLAGCTDPSAENYVPGANVEDGSCNYTWANACGTPYEICYDNNAFQTYTYCTPNVGTDAVIIDFGPGSVVEGFFDIINIYDGSDNTGTLLFSGDGDVSGLSFGAQSGCLSVEIISDASVNCADGVFVLGVNFTITCEPLVFGCTNPTANNYVPTANVDNGSCNFCGTTFGYCYGNNENFIQTFNGGPGENVEITITQGVVEAGFELFTVYDGPNTASPILFSGDGDVSGQTFLSSGGSITIQIISDAVISCEDGGIGFGNDFLIDVLCGLAGCDEPIACNYDAAAIFLDCGLCEYSSCLTCTYPDADNYTGPFVGNVIDNGSCIFLGGGSCPTDLNGDLITNTGDLTILIGAFGTNCP
jgi:hypothetical protein